MFIGTKIAIFVGDMKQILKKLYIYILATMAGLATVACGEKDEPTPARAPGRTVIVYMVADNSLGYSGRDMADLAEMATAARGGALQSGRLLVYHAGTGTALGKKPELKELDESGNWTTLKTYDADGAYSVDPQRMAQVIDDVHTLAPGLSYGLVLWSHATGWMDDGSDLRSFGDDRGYRMNLPSLASALEGNRFDFVYFDCCLMGTVEVAYELRHVTPCIIASGTELHVDGMPYNVNLSNLMAPVFDPVATAKCTFDFYDGLTGSDRMCTMTVVNTAGLDRLAAATGDIMKTGVLPPANLDLQQSYRPRYFTLYDMGRYIDTLEGVDPALISAWHSAYSAVVAYAASTDYILGYFPIKYYTGLGTHLLHGPDDAVTLGYNQLEWWKDVVSLNPSLNVPLTVPAGAVE